MKNNKAKTKFSKYHTIRQISKKNCKKVIEKIKQMWYYIIVKVNKHFINVEEEEETMCVNALDMSKYIINRCAQTGTPITNLKLQKILYFVWIDYYKATGEELFNDIFYAWKLGPVIPDIYKYYKKYGADEILEQQQVELPINTEAFINRIIDKYRILTAFDLVNLSHTSGSSWDIVFNGSGERYPISFDLIKSKCR